MDDRKREKHGGRHNATKHGIFARILLRGVALGESEEAYRALLAGLRQAIKPVDQVEDVQVEKLAFLYLRLTRVYAADWNVAPILFDKVAKALDEEEPLTETTWVNKENEVVVIRKALGPDLALRYEANIERQIARTLGLLQQWRMMREGSSGPKTGS